MRFVVLPVLAPALREGFFLGVLREPRDEVGMASRDALLLEGFSHFGDELEQSEAGINEAIALARFLGKGADIIARQVEEPLKPLRLLIGMHVDALRIFDQLPFDDLLVGELHDADGYLVNIGKVGGTEAPRSHDDLIAFAVGPNGN